MTFGKKNEKSVNYRILGLINEIFDNDKDILDELKKDEDKISNKQTNINYRNLPSE